MSRSGKSIILIPGDGTGPENNRAVVAILLRPAIIMLQYLNLSRIAQNVDQALRKVVRAGKATAEDLAGHQQSCVKRLSAKAQIGEEWNDKPGQENQFTDAAVCCRLRASSAAAGSVQ